VKSSLTLVPNLYDSANAQIAALEQKIAQMRDSPLSISAPGSRDASPGVGRRLDESSIAPSDTEEKDVDTGFEQGFDEMMAQVETATAATVPPIDVSRPSDPTRDQAILEPRSTPKPTSVLVGHPSLPQKPSSGTIERAKDLERLRK
jgi:hypothetical protein